MTKKNIGTLILCITVSLLVACANKNASNQAMKNHGYCSQLKQKLAQAQYISSPGNANSLETQVRLAKQYTGYQCENPSAKLITPKQTKKN